MSDNGPGPVDPHAARLRVVATGPSSGYDGKPEPTRPPGARPASPSPPGRPAPGPQARACAPIIAPALDFARQSELGL